MRLPPSDSNVANAKREMMRANALAQTLVFKSVHSLSLIYHIRRERLALALDGSKRSGTLKQVLNGPRHGDPLRKLLRSFSSTESKNWQNTEFTLSDSLQLRVRAR
jgi:hypothetical protein